MLHIRLSTAALLLATSCVLWTAVSMEIVTTCEHGHHVQRLSCDAGLISVQEVLYGRTNKETCSEGRPAQQLANTECAQEGTAEVLKKMCNGKEVCEINIDVVRNPDPCRGIFKYLQTHYTCVEPTHAVACEGSLAHLSCGEGEEIVVFEAMYGRLDQTTCSFKRPEGQLSKVDCNVGDKATEIVSASCSGKSHCAVGVTNKVFTDPCVGTYKYADVAYGCSYPVGV